MNDLLSTILIIVAGVLLVSAVIMVLRGLRTRTDVPSRAYGVQRQESRKFMLVAFSRAVLLLILALILFTIGFVMGTDPEVDVIEPTPSPKATTVPLSPTPESTIETPSITATQDTAAATPSDEAANTPESTASPQIVPTATPTTPSNVAWVNSVNGLWLREEPSIEGQEIELIPNETMLILLRGKEPPDLPEWQQVRVPSGNEGWVFIEYLLYSEEQQ